MRGSIVFFGSLFVCFITSLVVQANIVLPKDVPTKHWAATEIGQFFALGDEYFIQNGKFSPNRQATRADAVVAVAKMMNISLDTRFELTVQDVSDEAIYYQQIRKLAELEVIQNRSEFRPNEPITRAQISKIVATAFSIQIDNKNQTSFKDLPVNHWAKHIIESLADVGVIKGKTNHMFQPDMPMTRAELISIVVKGHNFSKAVQNYEIIYDPLFKKYINTFQHERKKENEVVEAVNKLRQQRGIGLLQYDAELSQIALIKVQDMLEQKYFAHVSPYYGYPWDMAKIFNYDYTSFGENIAQNFSTTPTVMDAWIASPTHYENLLKEIYTQIGVGIKKTPTGTYYWVQLFASK